MHYALRHAVVYLMILCPFGCYSQNLPHQPDLDELLMQTTFMVRGQAKSGGGTLGTAFIMGRLFAAQTQDNPRGLVVLVTAAHVLNEMAGDTAQILLRTQQAGTDSWVVKVAQFAIRKNGRPLWKESPDSDVAVMYVAWPTAITQPAPLSMGFLPDDDALKAAGAGPGIELKILGYPLGNPSNDAFFPVLRTGMIASYPLLPTSVTKSFLLDFRVFKGNSGGPVYYSPKVMRGGGFMCCPPQFVMGLVSQERSLAGPYSEVQLSLGVIVHASSIKKVIESLPAPDTKEALESEVPLELIGTP